jgi:hypothetical protein
MTLAAAWIESKDNGNRPLCFASDSRTTPGPIEGVTKVVLFGREDLAGVWAGDYRYASMLVSHLDAVFTASDVMRRRDVDVLHALRRAMASVQRHLTESTSPAIASFQQNAEAQMPERTAVLVGGYSLTQSSHMLLRIEWTPSDRRWRGRVDPVDSSEVVFIGDEVKRARRVARQIRSRRALSSTDWKMEPLATIHNACEDANRRTVGGRLQLAKAYMHGATGAYGFVDPLRSNDVFVRGARVDARAAQEVASNGRLIDLSRYVLSAGAYASRASIPTS